MSSTPRWFELYRHDDVLHVRAVATSIASMSFDVRLLDRRGVELVPGADADDVEPPLAVLVPETDYADLAAALPEIIAEQDAFDELLLRREQWIGRRRRSLLILLIAIVAVLSTFGLVRM